MTEQLTEISIGAAIVLFPVLSLGEMEIVCTWPRVKLLLDRIVKIEEYFGEATICEITPAKPDTTLNSSDQYRFYRYNPEHLAEIKFYLRKKR